MNKQNILVTIIVSAAIAVAAACTPLPPTAPAPPVDTAPAATAPVLPDLPAAPDERTAVPTTAAPTTTPATTVPQRNPIPTTPPVPPTTTPAAPTTTVPARTQPTPGYVRLSVSPLRTYTIRFERTVPSNVRSAFSAAAAQAAQASGIALTVGADYDKGVEVNINGGEIRITTGSSCSVQLEAGCTTVFGDDVAITAAQITVELAEIRGDTALLGDVALHELAHAVGLSHVDIDVAAHYPQIMGNPEGSILGSYQPGDRAGLAAVGASAVSR